MMRLNPFSARRPQVPVIRLQGIITSGTRSAALNDAGLAPMIERAFTKGKPAGVALVINSPGGSPAQSSLIAARIRRLAEERNIEVHAFVEDVAASGGYWLATAADKIWIDPNSILGSIGVISAGFGFHDLISRHGIERRVHTAGKSKSMLDPFQPEKPEDLERLSELQTQIHAAFIEQVKSRRGARLAQDDRLFTGEIWLGQQAVDVGLADGIGHVVPKLKEIYGDKVRLIPYRQKRPVLSRLGVRLADDLIGVAEDRLARARYGI